MSRCHQVQELYTAELLNKKGVNGTAVGEKWINGISTGKQAVLVFVEKKLSSRGVLRKFSANDLVPSDLEGIPTDVIEVGVIKKEAFKTKVRPVKPGYSVGHGKITAGTIGGVFKDRDGHPVILSNNHVLANENNAKNGDIIYQPGPIDSRANRRFRKWPDPVANLPYIGTLKKFVRLRATGNVQDSAIAKIHAKLIRDGLIDDMYPTINSRLTGFGNAKVGSQVQKCGRTTGYTTGRVIGINASFLVGYDFGVARFDRCIVLSNMSKGGDSGSIIQDMNEKAIGLLFAGSPRVTIANPMDVVRAHYGLELWTPAGSGGTTAKPPATTITLGNSKWATFKHSQSTATVRANVLKLHAYSNHHCCIERPISRFSSISCVVNTGSDAGATWGTGLTIQWSNGYIKVNLRKGGSFGGYFAGSHNISIGKTRPNTDYGLRIRRSGTNYIGEVRDGRKWHTVMAVPVRIFPHPPIAVRLGKTNLRGRPSPFRHRGKMGDSTIKDFIIN